MIGFFLNFANEFITRWNSEEKYNLAFVKEEKHSYCLEPITLEQERMSQIGNPIKEQARIVLKIPGVR